jgi:multidrug resistance efflux pump
MKEESARPIPIPLTQRWRDARMRLLPLVVFGTALCTITGLWKQHVAAPTMVGQAEPVVANVTSHKAGMLAELTVARFQKVKAGDPVGQVLITDPKILASSLAVAKAEIDLMRSNLKPIIAQQRNAVSYSRARLDWMRDRAQLASAQVSLQEAETEFHRFSELFKDQIVSQRQYDQAKAARERLQKEVDEMARLVAEGEANFKALQSSNTIEITRISDDPIHTAIAVQEAKLALTEAELSPIRLKAPMDGIVTTIYHRSGESIVAGQPIVSIATLDPVRIVGYLRPPITDEPKVGMKVEVRTRGLHREIAMTTIKEVGTQLEAVPATLSSAARFASTDLGLPIDIILPPTLRIRAGELVDLILIPAATE